MNAPVSPMSGAAPRPGAPGIRAAFAALLLAVSAVGFGCGEDNPESIRKVMPVTAIAFNDSVAKGDTLLLKVQYSYSTTCEATIGFEFATVGTNTYAVTPVAVYPSGEACTGVNGVGLGVLRVTDLGKGERTFIVNGSNTTITATVQSDTTTDFVTYGGTAFKVRVEDALGHVVNSAQVQIRNVDDNSVLAEGFTGMDGIFTYDRPCGPDLSYVVAATVGGNAQTIVVRTPPARCGEPQYVVIRV